MYYKYYGCKNYLGMYFDYDSTMRMKKYVKINQKYNS